jgi:hypothetical protein
MNVDGTVIGRNMQRHRHQEFIRFLATVERSVPAGKLIHAISTTMPPTNTPRCRPGSPSIRDGRFHFTPTFCSMPWKASSPSSLGRASNEASFARSVTSKARLLATSPPPTGTPSPSSGPRPRKLFRPNSRGTVRLSQCTAAEEVSGHLGLDVILVLRRECGGI